MAIVDHVEIDALLHGMPVVVAGRTIGRLEDLVPKPDRTHPSRLIVRRESDGRRIAIPIEWVRGVRDGTIELWVTDTELERLPEYIPQLPAAEAQESVQRALEGNPLTAKAGIQVTEREGALELRGRVPDPQARATASDIARGVPGVGAVRNRLGTAGDPDMSPAGYAYPWLHDLLERATGLHLDGDQIARIEDLAERKLVDLFDVAEDAAAANGRARVLRQDLPLTSGLQRVLLTVNEMAREFQLEPLLVFLADAGIRAQLDEALHSEIPRLMAALLIVTGQLVVVLESEDGRVEAARPSAQTLDRVAAILDLTL